MIVQEHHDWMMQIECSQATDMKVERIHLSKALSAWQSRGRDSMFFVNLGQKRFFYVPYNLTPSKGVFCICPCTKSRGVPLYVKKFAGVDLEIEMYIFLSQIK